MIAFIFALCLGMNQYWINSTELASTIVIQPIILTPTSTPIPDETTGEIGGIEPKHNNWYFPIIVN